ncbi:FAD-dependent monooxygenase [Cryptosporangium phraense]|uniref:FAD-binding protein n=1 Tax=Cryptosporangium phraense TaxID=2593070 RepID=A0A545AUV5_9ACTN|nr:FAD-dependent monooxygenase [Cryptosporangium phraense]TQS45119.1 FAD-binding protein [Cryptosporangium phraense]
MRKVLIIGAGIAGLGAAVSIARAGDNVRVVERSTSLAVGAAISMLYRGPDALAELGVLDACIAEGTVGYLDSVFSRMYDSSGDARRLPQLPVRSDGMPSYIIIYRPVIARILSGQAEAHGAVIDRGLAVSSLNDEGETVAVTFSDGTSDHYDLVVGADGTASETRQHLFGDTAQIDYSGNMSLRWVKPDAPTGPVGFYVSEESVPVVIHPLHGGLVYIATGVDMENRHVGTDEARQLFREILGQFDAPYVRELLSVVSDDDPVIARPYLMHHHPRPWHKGRIVLIGDAVHTLAANLGAGGVLGLEDGLVLGQELARTESLDAALAAFEERRFERTSNAVAASREMLDAQVNRQASPAELHVIRERAVADLSKPF